MEEALAPVAFLAAAAAVAAVLAARGSMAATRHAHRPTLARGAAADDAHDDDADTQARHGSGIDAAAAARVVGVLRAASAVVAVDDARYSWVDSAEGLAAVAAALAAPGVQAVAVDVEHTTARAFHGYVATVQLSVATPAAHDWIIDCTVPAVRAALRRTLAPTFLSAAVLKVLHGCANDVRWLSSNFGLHLVHVLDTAVAARATAGGGGSSTPPAQPPSSALAPLLAAHFSVASDKRLQRADWTVRPLPPTHVAYARTDTRYLLPLAARLLAAAPAEVVVDVLRRSHSLTSLRYDAAAREAFSGARAVAAAETAVTAARDGAAARAVVAMTAVAAYLRHATALRANLAAAELPEDAALVEGCRRLAGRGGGVCASDVSELGVVIGDADAPPAARLLSALAAADAPTLTAVIGVLRSSDGALLAAALAAAAAVSDDALTAALALPALARWRFDGGGGGGGGGGEGAEDRKNARAAKGFVPRAEPLYNNIELCAPDGMVLARIDRRKAQWYLDARLADLVVPGGAGGALGVTRPEDGTPPMRIVLHKPPRGLGHAGDSFHLAPKSNNCVICGASWEAAQATGGINRCYIVPHAVRQHFPVSGKSYSSHDVVLTCTACHRRADVASGELLRRIKAEFGFAAAAAAAKASATAHKAAAAAAVAAADADAAADAAAIARAAGLLAHGGSAVQADAVAAAFADLAARPAAVGALLGAPVAPPITSRDDARLKPLLAAAKARVNGTAGAPAPLETDADLARTIVRSVMLGDAAWRAAEANFPPADTEPCADCAAADAADAAAPPAAGSPPLPRSRCGCGRSFTPAMPPPPPAAAAAAAAGDAAHAGVDGASGLPRAAEDRLTRLVRRWRAWFLDRVRPLAMPDGWAVNYRVFQAGLRRDSLAEPPLVDEVRALLRTAAAERSGVGSVPY